MCSPYDQIGYGQTAICRLDISPRLLPRSKLYGLSEANRPMRTSQYLWRRLNGDYAHRQRTAVDYDESTRCRRLARAMDVNTEAALSRMVKSQDKRGALRDLEQARTRCQFGRFYPFPRRSLDQQHEMLRKCLVRPREPSLRFCAPPPTCR